MAGDGEGRERDRGTGDPSGGRARGERVGGWPIEPSPLTTIGRSAASPESAEEVFELADRFFELGISHGGNAERDRAIALLTDEL